MRKTAQGIEKKYTYIYIYISLRQMKDPPSPNVRFFYCNFSPNQSLPLTKKLSCLSLCYMSLCQQQAVKQLLISPLQPLEEYLPMHALLLCMYMYKPCIFFTHAPFFPEIVFCYPFDFSSMYVSSGHFIFLPLIIYVLPVGYHSTRMLACLEIYETPAA